ncbi:sigma-70 family RNA polymerase sigma factor [Viridibacillus sp. YIM B01967]|uniref:Sigma-70 family RNA polymerase sigma factor n=1 Tax=Viridibacillus soli TaxID=2798301 RepID=A0ABS1H330_9BACL|nr:sigma-70 family RNA polymerase sigma factor [Viridibacillus soli]MBK3493824.1 sigma-70 family RNA polymerase sigma factor [Viridibacillus soli]
MVKLVHKAQKGSERAFLKLFQQYEDDIYRIAYVYVKNESDALDVLQEVAYRAFKNIKTLNNPQYFKTWIIKIAMTHSINLVKKNRQVIHLEQGIEKNLQDQEEDFSLTVTIHEILEYLDEDEKSIVLLKFYEGYTFQEIAQLLNIPLGTTKSILYRALNKLRKQLKKEDFY